MVPYKNGTRNYSNDAQPSEIGNQGSLGGNLYSAS